MCIRDSVQAYMQCLYAADAVRINRSTAEASKAQRDRAEEMLRTGSILSLIHISPAVLSRKNTQ